MYLKQKIIWTATAIGFISLVVVPSLMSHPVSANCGGVSTAIINCTQGDTGKTIQDSGIWGILILVINILTAGIGIAAIGGLVYGSIIYTTAGGAPDQVKKAREIITNVVIGIIAYALMYALLNFIIPGGLF